MINWASPRAFELLEIGSFKFPSPGAKIVFKCPAQVLDLMFIFCKKQHVRLVIGQAL